MVEIREIARLEYESGLTVSEISKKYNLKVDTLKKWLVRYNWNKEKHKKEKKEKGDNKKRGQQKGDNKKGTTKIKKNKNEIIEEAINEVKKENSENYKKKEKIGRLTKLTEKQKNFIRNYFECKFNVKMATFKSGYTNSIEGYNLLKNERIKKIINKIKKEFSEVDSALINIDYLTDELLKNHYRAIGVIPVKMTEVKEKRERIPVILEVDGRRVVKYKETSEPIAFEYEGFITDIKASNQALQQLTKLYGLDELKNNEDDEKDEKLSKLLINIKESIKDG